MKEKIIWKGASSQWINFLFYFICVLLSPFVVGIFMAIWKYLDTKNRVYTITNERIILRKGILSKTTNEIELYRIKDFTVEEPFFMRLLGLTHIYLKTADYTHPQMRISGLKDGMRIKEQLRISIDIRRDVKGVREVDFNG